MQQRLVEFVNIGLHYTLPLGTLSPLIPCPTGCIKGHELLLEEELSSSQAKVPVGC